HDGGTRGAVVPEGNRSDREIRPAHNAGADFISLNRGKYCRRPPLDGARRETAAWFRSPADRGRESCPLTRKPGGIVRLERHSPALRRTIPGTESRCGGCVPDGARFRRAAP